MRFTSRTYLVLITTVVAVTWFCVEVNHRVTEIGLNHYYLQGMGDLLVEFMEERERWPRDWKDIESFVQEKHGKNFSVDGFRAVYSDIHIDFRFDPYAAEIPNEWPWDKPPQVVIWTKYGNIGGATRCPNGTIFKYLKKKRGLGKMAYKKLAK